MKKMLLFTVLCVVSLTTQVFSQTLMDYVSATKGDTLVVKTQDEMAGAVNALYQVVFLDTVDVPEGRVYELAAGGVYPLQNNPNGRANRTTRIVGSDPTPLVNNKNTAAGPAYVVGNVAGDGTANTGGLGSSGNLIVQNCSLAPTAPDGTENWLYAGTGQSNTTYEFDNCLFEHTRWAEVGVFNAGCSIKLKDCYFVNLVGQPCRRNGGVYDGFANVDTFLVENCTHINTQGSMYKWRNYTANRIIMNHNTFVDCAGYIFMDLGTQVNASYTNNIFVNCNVQPYPGTLSIDDGEADLDNLPMGLVNVYPDSALEANSTPRKFLVEANVAYWDPYLSNVADTANALQINNRTTWANQMILMNTRTKAMFDNSAKYPLLTEGVWYTEKPNFTDAKNLFGSALVELKKFAVSTVDTSSTAVIPDWRLVSLGQENYIYPDYPIQVDLSYSNATLKTGGTNGFPVGDLNWFPAQKTAWLAQRTAEYAKIQNVVDNGGSTLGVATKSTSPVEFALSQNYPNPFNPTTTISFSLPNSGNVRLTVFDVLGHEIATLVNGTMTQGVHDVQFDASKLASGVYFYKLSSGNFIQMKKMMLLK